MNDVPTGPLCMRSYVDSTIVRRPPLGYKPLVFSAKLIMRYPCGFETAAHAPLGALGLARVHGGGVPRLTGFPAPLPPHLCAPGALAHLSMCGCALAHRRIASWRMAGSSASRLFAQCRWAVNAGCFQGSGCTPSQPCHICHSAAASNVLKVHVGMRTGLALPRVPLHCVH